MVRRRSVRRSFARAFGSASSGKDTSRTVGARRRVEIIKLLYRGAAILILDEPTAALTPPEWHELGQFIRGLADQGRSVIFITHKLDELFGLDWHGAARRARGRHGGASPTWAKPSWPR
jgi:ABC-type sugar transport system ATPase subunit